jgi:hypothetical protein
MVETTVLNNPNPPRTTHQQLVFEKATHSGISLDVQ